MKNNYCYIIEAFFQFIMRVGKESCLFIVVYFCKINQFLVIHIWKAIKWSCFWKSLKFSKSSELNELCKYLQGWFCRIWKVQFLLFIYLDITEIFLFKKNILQYIFFPSHSVFPQLFVKKWPLTSEMEVLFMQSQIKVLF